MIRFSRLVVVGVLVLYLGVFPVLVCWDVTHPDRRYSAPGNETGIRVPAWGVTYALMTCFGVSIFLFQHWKKRRTLRAVWLLQRAENFLREERLAEAVICLNECKALTGFKASN